MSIFRSEIGSRFGESGGTPSPRIPRNTNTLPPPPPLSPGLLHRRKGFQEGAGGGSGAGGGLKKITEDFSVVVLFIG